MQQARTWIGILGAACLAVGLAAPAPAQQFTTAGEIKPMLDATRARWIAVREYDGQDLLYFTHLLAWRCGLETVRYSVNGGAQKTWDAEPCYEGEAAPNAIKDSNRLPYVSFPLGSVETVSVQIEYDDGSVDSATYKRAEIMTN